MTKRRPNPSGRPIPPSRTADAADEGGVDSAIKRVQKVTSGFLAIEVEAKRLAAGMPPAQLLDEAKLMLQHDAHQVRILGTILLGSIAAGSKAAVKLLRSKVVADEDWRVQENLARAFDQMCADLGYEAALPVIEDWLHDKAANARRAVTEGLRIWTGRPFFKDRPGRAIGLLAALRDDESAYVRRSVGNAIRDISKRHPALVRAEIAQWNESDPKIADTLSHLHKRRGKPAL